MTSLNVVCLISGGKDSLFSILHCLENGHQVVALANLHPPLHDPGDAVDDLDSYMYQTVGHTIIPLYERALGIPLYRQEIIGSALNQEKSYGISDKHMEDETEALVPLLRKVKAHHPEINAVSTGAILSDYQRTRVESVAIRLGLTPLSYLWQFPSLPPSTQASLLEDMAAVGQDARIIKVASGGLDENFLWLNVADRRTISRLGRAAKRFGSSDDGAVLGEGGEYETLAVAGPAPLWKARIRVDEGQRTVAAGEAGSALLRILKAEVESIADSADVAPRVRVPPLLDVKFQIMLGELQQRPDETSPRLERTDGLHKAQDISAMDHVLLAGLTGAGINAQDQVESIMKAASGSLIARGHSFNDVAYSSILLRDMNDFAAVNEVYGSFFRHPNPPARVTLACSSVLPPEKHLMLSLTSVRTHEPNPRKGLHVQSRSYWAPANIGPYSQAVSVLSDDLVPDIECDVVYIAGQIPLIPASMDLVKGDSGKDVNDFCHQTVLALQHFVRIGKVMQVKQWACGIAFITAPSLDAVDVRSQIACRAWGNLHAPHQPKDPTSNDSDAGKAEDTEFDVWNIRYGNWSAHSYSQYMADDLSPGDHYTNERIPPLYVILVDALPRGADIEWVTYGLTSRRKDIIPIPHFQHLLNVFKEQIVSAK